MKREYTEITLHDDDAVMFKMKNGWYYLVRPELDHIAAFQDPMFFTKFCPYAEYGTPDNKTRKKAEFKLQTTPTVIDAMTEKKLDESQQNTFKFE